MGKKKMSKKQKKQLKKIIKKMKKIYKDIKKVDEDFCFLAQQVIFLDENALGAFQKERTYKMPHYEVSQVQNGKINNTKSENFSST